MSIDPDTEFQDTGSDALAPGSKLLSGQYEILRYLSSGGFGITYLARDSLNRTVVIKECFPEAFCSRVNKTVRARTRNYVEDFRSVVQLFIREAHALSRLKHPSVVGVHQVFEDNETAYMALDLIDGKDLLDIIEEGTPVLAPADVQHLTLKLLDAIEHVHSQDLLHRDISPDNILVDKSGHPVLIDFGAAREEASRKSRALSAVLVVKDGYSPQEFYVAGSQQQPSSDLYALAATLSHLISGNAPPGSQARLAALASSQPDLYEPLSGRFPDYDDAFLAAIDKAMSIVPADRLQSAEDWTLMIDHSKRVERARARAIDDKSIDETVMNLVRAVNEEPKQPAPQAAGPSAKPLQRPAIVPVPRKHEPAPEPEIIAARDPVVVVAGPRDKKPAMVSVGAEIIVPNLAPAAEDAAKSTPYTRITSKALQASEQSKSRPGVFAASRKIIRLASVPVVFCAYFFYGHTVLQYDAVRAATVQPLLNFSSGYGSEASNAVVVRKGVGG